MIGWNQLPKIGIALIFLFVHREGWVANGTILYFCGIVDYFTLLAAVCTEFVLICRQCAFNYQYDHSYVLMAGSSNGKTSMKWTPQMEGASRATTGAVPAKPERKSLLLLSRNNNIPTAVVVKLYSNPTLSLCFAYNLSTVSQSWHYSQQFLWVLSTFSQIFNVDKPSSYLWSSVFRKTQIN